MTKEETEFSRFRFHRLSRFGDAVWVVLRHGSFLTGACVQALQHLVKAWERSLSTVVFFPIYISQRGRGESILERDNPIVLLVVSFYSFGISGGEMMSISR
jgi:hypothetical protein